MAVHIIAAVGGALVVVLTVGDVVGSLLVTQGRPALWRPSRLIIATTWPGWRFAADRLFRARREQFLARYGPLTLLLMLLVWLSLLLVGWALLYLGISDATQFAAAHDFAGSVYFSSGALLTAGLAGSAPPTGVLHVAALLETVTSLGIVALFIAYVPGVFAAYNRREARLLTLDDPAGRRITPVAVLTLNAPDGDLGRLGDFFAGWEQWTADVLESQTAYPVLNFFRSRHAGQSWVTALGALVEASALACAVIPGAEEREPLYMYRRGRRAVSEISARLRIATGFGGGGIERERLRLTYSRLVAASIPARDFEDAWRRLQALHEEYAAELAAFVAFFSAPREFVGHSTAQADGAVRAAR